MISSSLMNRILTISAIAMFAVVLGVSAFAPAMATPPDRDPPHKVVICHYQEEKTEDRFGNTLDIPIPEAYVDINIDKAGKMNGHFKNDDPNHFPVDDVTGLQNGQGDFVITVVEDEAVEPFDNSEADCIKHNADIAQT